MIKKEMLNRQFYHDDGRPEVGTTVTIVADGGYPSAFTIRYGEERYDTYEWRTKDDTPWRDTFRLGDQLRIANYDDDDERTVTCLELGNEIAFEHRGGFSAVGDLVEVDELSISSRFYIKHERGARCYWVTCHEMPCSKVVRVGDRFKIVRVDGKYVFCQNLSGVKSDGVTASKGASEMRDEKLQIDNKEVVDVVRTGVQILVPPGMDLDVVVEWLKRKKREEEEVISVVEPIEGYILDAAHSFMLALREKYGFVASEWFSKTTMISVPTGVHTSINVPWGAFTVPAVDGTWKTQAIAVRGKMTFHLVANVKRKFEADVKEVAVIARKKLETESIYRRKAIRIVFDDPGEFDYTNTPSFIDTTGFYPAGLIFPQTVQDQISTNIFTPIRKTARLREMHIPIKRGVLLAGPFGVGKTLTANISARMCEEHGWSFIYLRKVEQLSEGIEFARTLGGPAVVFADDVDRIARERDDAMNDLLNTIDGIDSKTSEVMVVLTTNYLSNIEASMLRPGRLDAVIDVLPPDAEAAQGLVKLYAGSLLRADQDLTEVGRALDGKIPAVIREVVERSKLAAIGRVEDGEPICLEAADLIIAAAGMDQHLRLLTPKPEDRRSELEKAASIIAEKMTGGAPPVHEKPIVPLHKPNGAFGSATA